MSKKLFVGSFPQNTTEQTLKDLFAPHGAVLTVSIIKDGPTGASRGFGFVDMATDEEAAKAIEKLNGSALGDRKIVVKEALAKTSYKGMHSDMRNARFRGRGRF